jgi:hypothetical protein
MKRRHVLHPRSVVLLSAILPLLAGAFLLSAQALAQSPVQTEDDEYTRYELLAPETQSFHILYDVTATTPSAQYYFNELRKGSEHVIHGVADWMTGAPLEWKIVDGKAAKEGGVTDATPDGAFLQVKLARPVPAGGEARIRIDKTYKDPASYFREGDKIVFARSLGIKRNSVVLPAGYELVGCNYPSQIRRESDGRIVASFMNPGAGAISYRVEARALPAKKSEGKAAATATPKASAATESREVSTAARVSFTFSERAFQDREIVYFLQQPETHAFRLYHDYTETREGMDHYLNIVRTGSNSSNPSAKILDTGEVLKVETLKAAEATKRGIKMDEPVTPDTEVVVIWFPAVKKGQSVRLRIEETYTDANRYLLVGDELVWDRSFGRPRNAVVLPEGWSITANSIPAVVTQLPDGRIQLFYTNDRPDEIAVFIRARRR